MDSMTADQLGYGDFYGIVEVRFDLPQFSIGIVAPDARSIGGKRHSHTDTHLMFSLEGEYLLSSNDTYKSLPPRTLVFVPAGTTHANHPATPRTRMLTISVAAAQVASASDHVRLPQAEAAFRDPQLETLAKRLAAECADWTDSSALIASGIALELLGGIARRAKGDRTPPRG